MIFAVIVVSLAMLLLFFGVTIAGGRAHDRHKREARIQEEREARERGTGK